jgi:hypothetical protein
MKKSEKGKWDIFDLVVFTALMLGLLFGVGPCGSCFYNNPKDAPFEINRYR